MFTPAKAQLGVHLSYEALPADLRSFFPTSCLRTSHFEGAKGRASARHQCKGNRLSAWRYTQGVDLSLAIILGLVDMMQP